ncbi:integrase catalytic domain-containing protein [Trichonephila clavipes]|nr:integrase catalytic domain-containing protein [Trichonephila clavipes]
MDYLSEISSFKKIIRVTAWIYRFYHNLRKQRNDRDFGELIPQETDAAERKVLKIVQKQSFSNDTKSLLSQMQTLVDSDGIIRIKSKIIMRKDVESIRYPIVLPSRHPIVTKLIIQKHIELLHAGVQTVMSALRENYWILKSRKTVRRVLSECIICKRFTVRPLTTLSPPLPEDRVREAQIFEITVVDLCGPLFLRDRTKSWIVLFTCAVFRAVHMELVTSLSTESFILALRRFISRRGRPFIIYSDNGKNLVGTSNELKNIDWKKVKDYGSLKKINWKLNPPSSPWWGVLGTAYRNAKNNSQKSPRKSLPNLRRTLYCSMRL